MWVEGVDQLRRGMVVLENDQYGPCVHKIMSNPFQEDGLLVVNALDLDDFRLLQLGGEGLEIQILIHDGKELSIREIANLCEENYR